MNNQDKGIISDEERAVEEFAQFEASKLGLKSEGGGAFREITTDNDEMFWSGASTAQAFLDHRIPELKAWLTYQYKETDDGKAIRIRTLLYKMTTRPLDKPWYRGNLDVHFSSNGSSVIASPDSMWQQVQPSEFISYVKYGTVPSNGQSIDVSMHCNFDGTNNDGWEKSPVVRHTDIRPLK